MRQASTTSLYEEEQQVSKSGGAGGEATGECV